MTEGQNCRKCGQNWVSAHEVAASKRAVCGKCYLKKKRQWRKIKGLL